MSVEIVRGTSQKPVSSDALVEIISRQSSLSGQLFIGYPIVNTSAGRHPVDALLVSPDKGIVVFDLVEGRDAEDYGTRQDDLANGLEARLRTHRELTRRRDLLIPIHTLSFAPAVNAPASCGDPDYPLADASSLLQELEKLTWQSPGDRAAVCDRTAACDRTAVCDRALSAIESISAIRKIGSGRRGAEENSRGAKLAKLENSIATLDSMQSRAVIETAEGVQRIRGLAGSGKTIVLALKASYLHASHPDWRIAVTFLTRSLKEHFRRLITHFSIEQTGGEPDWDKLRILNAWGAPGDGERDGLYYQFCRTHDVEYLDFRTARRTFAKDREMEGACECALSQARERRPAYDAILVDEAQDLSAPFLRLCHALLERPGRLVYAYDELQNLSDSSLPPPEEIFGKNADGSPSVRWTVSDRREPQRDIVLSKCYRNSKPVLVTAHALGFGIYREPPRENETGLVQMFDHPKLWEDIGYRVRDGELRDGSPVTLLRLAESSLGFLEDHSELDDLIRFIAFDDEERQADWLAREVARNLSSDGLRHEDIMVINSKPRGTRTKVGPMRNRLMRLGIKTLLAGVDTDPDIFYLSDDEMVTFTGVHRAKGNEAGMVYIVNAQDCHSTARNLAVVRNRLFTAITRSKAWVRVLGVGESMTKLKSEYEALKARNFELRFTYPTTKQRARLRLIHRDMATEESGRLENRDRNLNDLLEDLESGAVRIEDLDEGTLARFKKVLREKR